MNGSAKRLMAVMLASVMIASAMVVVLVDEQDSSAEVTPANYYYSQLEMDFSKTVYEVINTIYETGDVDNSKYSISGMNVTIKDISSADKDALKEGSAGDPYFLSNQINRGIVAAVYDNPLVGFYISTTYPATSLSHTGEFETVSFTVNKISSFPSVADGKAAMESVIAAYTPGVSGTIPSKVTTIHNHVADVLTYDTAHAAAEDPTASEIRSVYTGLCGDYMVVCEGYAKMFKALCDECSVPCLIATGKAGTDGDKENHMWNYVQIDGLWYLVDCTWDDQATLTDEYLMAGTSTIGFDSKDVRDTYDYSGLDAGLRINDTITDLSALKYGEGGTQYVVTFLYDPESDPDAVYSRQRVKDGDTASVPDDPKDDIGHHFLGWYQHGSDTAFNFETAITSDVTIDGKWTSIDVYTLKYETDGGTVIQATRVESTDNTTKITDTEPKKEGYKFIEWNTAKNGGGISYKGGEDITLVGDCTLYAVWEDTSSVTFKIDNVMAQAAEFLSKESIPGVSNFLLTIGVITTVVSLIAVIAIARK